MGADNYHKSLILFGLRCELFGHFALTDYIFEFNVFQKVGHAGVTTFDFLAYRSFVFTLFFHINKSDVALPFVGNIDCQIHGVGRAGGKVKSDDNVIHSYKLFV